MGARRGLRLGSRYRVLRKLGEGTFGEVFLVEDRLLGREVALKRFKPLDVDFDVREMLREEFLVLYRLRHPGLPRVYDVSVDPGAAYFTMEHLAGPNLLEHIRGGATGPLPAERVPEAISAALSILSALRYIHSRGVIHGDLKPANILYRATGARPAAGAGPVLLDFGLHLPRARERGFSGTLAYVAPEVIRDRTLGTATDVFSLGVVLYELLAGRNPLLEVDPGRRALGENPRMPRLSASSSSISGALDDIVARMIAPDPALRYVDAEQVQRDLLLAAGWSGSRASDLLRADFQFDPGSELFEEQTAAVRASVSRVLQSGQGELVRILAAPGVPLDRFLRHVRAEVQAAGGVSVKCSAAGASASRVFEEICLRLTSAESLRRSEARLRDELRKMLVAHDASDPGDLDRRMHAAFERLARFARAVLGRRVGDGPRRRRAVWILADADRSEGTVRSLVRFLAGHASTLPVVLLLAGMETNELASIASEQESVRLPAPGVDDVRRLLEANCRGILDADRLAGVLHERVQGDLGLLESLVEELVRCRALDPSPDGWTYDLQAARHAALPVTPADDFARRWERLGPRERQVLSAASVLGGTFDVRGVSAVGTVPPRSVGKLLDTLEAGRWLQPDVSRRGGAHLRFADPTTPSRIQAQISARDLSALRGAAAKHLERRVHAGDEGRRETLAALLEELGRWRDAARHLEELGDRARSRLDLERAYWLLRRADELLRKARAAPGRQLLEALSEVAHALGRFEESLRHTRRLLRSTGKRSSRRRTYLLRKAEAMRRSGDHRSARRILKQLLEAATPPGAEEIAARHELARIEVESGNFGNGWAIYDEAVRLAERIGRKDLAFRGLLSRGEVSYRQGEPDAAEADFQACLQLARTASLRVLLPDVYLGFGVLRMDRHPPDAIPMLERAVHHAERYANVLVLAHAHHNLGIVRTDLGDLDEARRHFVRARQVFAAGRPWDEARVIAQLGNLARRRGDFAEAEAHYRRCEALSQNRPESHPSARMARLNHWSLRQSRGEQTVVLEEMRAAEGEFGPDHPRSHMAYLMNRASLERHAGSAEDAAQVAETLREVAERHQDRYFRSGAAMILGVLRARDNPSLAESLLEESLRIAQELGNLLVEGEASMHLAWFLAERGDRVDDGRRHLQRAATIFERARMKPMLERIARIREAFAEKPGPAPHAREALGGKELSTLYRASRAIRSCRSLEELLSELLDAAIELMGAERGLIFLVVPGTRRIELRASRGSDNDTLRDAGQISRTILQRALQDAQPVYSTNALEDERFRDRKSVVNYGIRSFMCAPLVLADRVLGTIYVDHRRRDNLFAAADAEFLMAFAGFAAAAIDNARMQGRLLHQVRHLRREIEERVHPADLIGDSVEMRSVLALVERVAPGEVSILVHGESGTGKELVARALHDRSARRDGPFVPVNCAAIPSALVESELFGTVRGAATDTTDRPGKFEEASGGTLFLDEIADLALDAQAKILRAIQERRVERLGSNRAVRLDVRLIAATNRSLEEAVEEGSFREDLYYRLNVVEIHIPALRERRDDIAALVRYYVERFCREQNKARLGIPAAVMASYEAHDWPGNVRELRNAVERGVLLAEGDSLPVFEAPGRAASHPAGLGEAFVRGMGEREIERAYARYVFERVDRSMNRASSFLGIDFKTLQKRLSSE